MALAHSPSTVMSGLILNLDAGNPLSFGSAVANSALSTVEVLVVAGGGAGGAPEANTNGGGGGGGGGGGVIYSSSFPVTAGTAYTVTVGSGGISNSIPLGFGSNGNNSSFGSLTAIGGGGGGGGDLEGAAGIVVANPGGSGGGAGGDVTSENQALGTPGQGNPGGARGSPGNNRAGAGGGGAAQAGFSGTRGINNTGLGGTGGNGISSDITGTATFYGGGGGGGACQNASSGVKSSTGGLGGGGAGAGDAAAVAGTANTGGGGGGGYGAFGLAGANGGSGVVIIRYPGLQQATGGTITSVPIGFTRHTFTTSGTFTTLSQPQWRDLSGNGKNAALFNSVGSSGDGGGSLTFNGSNQYALVGPLTSSLTTTMSFSIWFRTNSLAVAQTLWWDDDSQGGGDSWISIETTGKIQSNRNPDGYGVLQSNATIATGTWYNFTFVANGSAGKLFYINGALDTSDSVPINSRQGRSYVAIGVNTPGAPNPSSGYFNGSIAVFTAYGVALTSDQVAQNFNALRGRFGI